MAALLAVTSFGAPVPPPAAAQDAAERQSPLILLDTPCAPFVTPDPDGRPNPPITIALRGFNWAPDVEVAISYAGGIPAEPSATGEPTGPSPNDRRTPDRYGYFASSFEVPTPSAAGTVDVLAVQGADGESRATAVFLSPCQPTVTLSLSCGPSSGADPAVSEYVIDVVAEHLGPDLPVDISFGNAGAVVYSQPDAADASGRVEHQIRTPTLPAGGYEIVVSQPRRDIAVRAPFSVPCEPGPSLAILPDCGEPGGPPDRYTLELRGERWLPGRTIVIIFDWFGSGEVYQWARDVPDTGSWGPVSIDPGRRPAGEYWVRVLQFAGLRLGATAPGSGPEFLEALATFRAPCPPELVESVAIDAPACGPPAVEGDPPERRYAIVLRGVDWAPGADVRITFDADRLSSVPLERDTFTAVAQADGTFSATIDPLVRAPPPTGSYRILAQQLDGDVAYTSDDVLFAVPCEPADARVRLEPTCGADAPGVALAYSVIVHGRRYFPGRVEIVFDVDGTPETFTAEASATGRFDQPISLGGRSPGAYRVIVRQPGLETAGALAEAEFVVPCEGPTLTFRPSVGQPGYVSFVLGAGFPADTTVTLTWDRGIEAGVVHEVETDGNGMFERAILIFYHDFLGRRALRAAAPGDPDRFGGTRATYTVLAGHGSPPGAALIDPFTGLPQAPIVNRR